MDNIKAKELIEKYRQGRLSDAEQALLEGWYLDWHSSDALDLTEAELNRDFKLMRSNIPMLTPKRKLYRVNPVIGIAASLFVVLAAGLLYFFIQNWGMQHRPDELAAKDIAPGKNIAFITLSSGKQITLSNAKSGVMVDAMGLSYEDGTPIDKAGAGPENSTISTPLGGQYKVTLPDGTKVILNASSSLKFPASFAGLPNRKVELTGEGYFRVARDAKHPFIVLTDKQEVEVLGTHFNINSYADEPFTLTTLEEGKVHVRGRSGKSAVLSPGQQSSVTSGALVVSNADVEAALAWKNGDFIFNGEQIESIMRKVARWYNIDVEFVGKMPSDGLYGQVSRSKNISQVLKALELTKSIHFKIEERKVIVMGK